MKHAIPDAVLSAHTAILGMTGSGKTSTGKLIVEQVVAAGHRVCVLDTLKSDWWGITSSASGKRPGLPFRILGGPRGHVPLHSSAGKVIGQLVGAGKLPLSIVDMADFEAGGVQRFFVDFAQALWRSMHGVVYLVIEEAHELAPKERAGFNAENMSIHWAKKLATGSRSKGVRLIVASQSVQQLHNRVLGACQTLIAHQIMFDADQVPVLNWIKGVDKAIAPQVAETIGTLPLGTAWICAGRARIFEKVHLPKISTFDNTATPDGNAGELQIKTAAVDQDQLKTLIGDAIKEAEATDPKALQARIAELQAELRKSKAAPAPAADAAAIAAADADGYKRGLRETMAAYGAFGLRLADIATVLDAAREATLSREGQIKAMLEKSGTPNPLQAALKPPPAGAAAPVRPPARPIASRPSPPNRSWAASSDVGVTGPQRQLLEALAWWKAMGHDEPSRVQVAAIAGWKPRGSNLRNRLSELSNAGLVAYPREGFVALTEAGSASAPIPDTTVTLIDSIRAVCTGPMQAVFDQLLVFRGKGVETVTRDELAAALGWEPAGSNLRNRLSELSAIEVVEYPAKGTVALQQWVTG